jgi:outer membrane protein OmpA-like peptidoglycan-associated protein
LKIAVKILVILFTFTLGVSPQKQNTRRTHNFSGTVPVTLSGIVTLAQTDYKITQASYGAEGMVEYFLPRYSSSILGFRISLAGCKLAGRDNSKTDVSPQFRTDVLALGAGVTAGYSFKDKIFPFIYAGVSNLWFSPKDIDGRRLNNNRLGKYSLTALSYDAEFGMRLILQEVLSMYASAGLHFPQSDHLDDIKRGSFNDFYYSGKVGISLSLFDSKDSDGDGFSDSDDPCPSNAEDFDGFEDEDGCPDYDNDGDKIPDEIDKCTNEKEDYDGFQDEDGCPDYDNDNDGIPDSIDKCPNVPENINGYEDNDGCPDILSNLQNLPDRDKDGIPDETDECPDEPETFNGSEDRDGCPDNVVSNDTVSSQDLFLDAMKLFEYRGYELKSTGIEQLDAIVKILEVDPFIKWTVESYTDDFGDSDSLKYISQQRAFTIVRYLIDKGLPSFMFKIISLGSESPIADNKSLEGRLKNNRIVIKKRY